MQAVTIEAVFDASAVLEPPPQAWLARTAARPAIRTVTRLVVRIPATLTRGVGRM